MKEKDVRISVRIPDSTEESPIVNAIKEQIKKIGIPESKFMYKVVPAGDRHG